MTQETRLPILVLVLLVAACQPSEDLASSPQSGENSAEVKKTSESPLAGAWRVITVRDIAADGTITEYTPQESFVLFTDDYYSMAYAVGQERFQMFSERWRPDEAEKIERFSSLTVNAGPYHVSGNRLVVKPQFALYPEVMTGTAEIEYEISGDTLTLTYIDQVSGDGIRFPYFEGGTKYLVQFERLK